MTPHKNHGMTGCRSLIQCVLLDSLRAGLHGLILLSLMLSLWQPLSFAVTPGKDATPASASELTEREKIIHALSRITFSARPGDQERVQTMGLKNFIEQQLHSEVVPEPALAEKLANLETLTMASSQLVQAYPPPNVVKQLRERQGGVMDNSDDRSADERASKNADSQNPRQMPLRQGNQRKVEAAETEMVRNPEMRLEGPRKIIAELQQAKLLRAVYSERQLYEQMVDFWENHFNIFAGKGADRWLLTEYDRDVIRPNAMGKFKDLVEATAHSSAMLFYLDNWLSADPNARPQAPNDRPLAGNRRLGTPRYDRLGRPLPPLRNPYPQARRFPQPQRQPERAQNNKQQKRGLNENYARELMELHTMGVDGGYTQQDVTEVARCFTGWTIRAPRQGGEFFFDNRIHDNGAKIVLGHKIHAGGIRDGEEVIDLLVHHPSTAKFVAKKLVTRFVSDNPPESLVERVAATYSKTDGDIREMLRTIFYAPEFNSKEAYRAKVKSPFELVVSAIRTTGGDTNASIPLLQFIAKMGQPLFLYQAPTGYPDRASEWLNTGTLLTRMNFALAFAANRIPGTNVEFSKLLADVNPSQVEDVRGRLLKILVNDDVSEQTRAALSKDARQPAADNSNLGDFSMVDSINQRAVPVQLAGLIIGSPEFQRR